MNAFAHLDAKDYLSPLVRATPDLRSNFPYLWGRLAAPSLGHVCYSDWADKHDDDPQFGIWKQCGFWTRDEAAILYHAARSLEGKDWVDVGANVGWTTQHIMAGSGRNVFPIDYLHDWAPVRRRYCDNARLPLDCYEGAPMKSEHYWIEKFGAGRFASGFCIDADHGWGSPLNDGIQASRHLCMPGVIIFHDFIGGPVQQAVDWLISAGFRCRVYFTPAMVALCWKGYYNPPDHEPDPRIADMLKRRCRDFDFSRCV